MQKTFEDEIFFSRKKGVMQMNLKIDKKSDNYSLSIQLIHVERCDRFSLTISENYIQEQGSHFQLSVQSIAGLYQTLVDQFDHLRISEDGCITLTLVLTSKRQTIERQYQIQAVKEEMDPIKHVALQIEVMRRQLKESLKQKDNQIAQQKTCIQKLSDEMDINKQNTVKLMSKVECLQEERLNDKQRISILETQIESLIGEVKFLKQQQINKVQRIKQIQQIKKEIFQKISDINEQNLFQHDEMKKQINQIKTKYSLQMEKMQENLQKHEVNFTNVDRFILGVERKKHIDSLQMHPENIQRQSFTLVNILQSISIVKIGKDKIWESYTSREPLHLNTHIFRMKQKKTQNQHIMLGIGTKNAIGVINAYAHKETLLYQTYQGNGLVYKNGSGSNCGPPVLDGQILSIKIDRFAEKVEWFINDKSAYSTDIPEAIRNQSLYLFVSMYNCGDEIEILV